MKLGGHETFYPRPGWLTKGLLHLDRVGPGSFSSPEVADELGVGRNMAKSLGWWLTATGLAERPKPGAALELSDFGRVIISRDPFMVHLGTWWLVHAASQTAGVGTTLPWFFNPKREKHFERAGLIRDLTDEMTRQKGKPPSTRSVQREVAVVLQAYAVPIPKPQGDPEDNIGSPFHRLALLHHIRSTDRFEPGDPTPVPVEALGLILSALGLGKPSQSLPSGESLTFSPSDPSISRAASMLRCRRETILELAATGARELSPDQINLIFHASERKVTVKSAQAAAWASWHFDRMDRARQDLAA